jgi:predicted Zn-dependent peptidase
MTTSVSKLSNGLHVATQKIEHAHSVALGIWVKSGTRHESKSKKGLSHLLEHMAFKGTAAKNSLEIARDFERLGAQINAYTSREVTSYHVRVLKEYVYDVLGYLADIFLNSQFNEEELVKEKKVVLQELAEAEDTPDDIIFDDLQDVAFPDQSMGWSILGERKTIKKITREDLLTQRETQYTGSNAVIAAVGDINHQDFLAHTASLFGELDQGSPNISEKATFKAGRKIDVRPLQQQHIAIGFEGVSFYDPLFYPLAIYSTLLGGGMSSRLFEEVREKRGLAYSIHTFNSVYTDTGLFGVYAGTEAKDSQEVIRIILDEIEKTTKHIHDDEILRAKNQVKSSVLMNLENLSSSAETLAGNILYWKKPIEPLEIIEKIDNIGMQDLKQIALQLLERPHALASVGPFENF